MIRRGRREAAPFGLAMLDVIAGAMGAFLLLTILLLPFYGRSAIDLQRLLDEAESAAATARSQVRQLEQQLARQAAQLAESNDRQAHSERARAELEAQLSNLRQRLASTFMVLYVRWDTRDDVDLHLIDPAGAEFSFQRKTIPGRPGELSEDNTIGPGNEVWEIAAAPPGAYQVHVRLYEERSSGQSVQVKGRVFYRDGSSRLPEVTLMRKGDSRRMTTIHVAEDGSIRLQ